MTTEEFHKNIYRNIEYAINKSEISKTELASKLGIANATVSYVLSKLKNGKTINTNTLTKWAEALNVPIDFFFENKCNW